MSRRRVGSLAVAALVAGAIAAAAFGVFRVEAAPAQGTTLGDPRLFVKRVIGQIVRDDYARAWLTLHPAHKAAAPRWTYVVCELLSPVAGDIVSLEVVGVTDRRISVAGVGRLPAKGVTFKLVLNEPAVDETIEVWHTAHLVTVRGRWRWILTPERYEYYLAGACGPRAP
jgi:hypothetical protein